ncbi:MAG: electron transfer flavoprotein-quinone oxidoreductase [Clostridia bacterium]|jgi:electron transfer flavoprotein-quinone oxidoreductase|nr:electron transfer flavoprotein-quinone oxidoreductase [Clostridia bacterium]
MPEEKFDCIIVGAGPAGSTAGFLLANAGLEVLIIERGTFAGSKNMTGGRLYSHSLEKIISDFASVAPVERKVVKETITMLTNDSAVSIDFQSQQLNQAQKESYTVLRADFDQWLAGKAEDAGAILAPGVRVDDLLFKDGKVTGVIAGEDEMEADVVILADGVNSLLAQKAGLKVELKPNQVAVGVKEVIELPAQVIEDRFGLNKGEGAARIFVGNCTKGKIGGGFLYTNKNSLSLGLVFTLADLAESQLTVPQMLEEFKSHPVIKPLIKDGKLVEYSAHLVPEAGLNMLPKLYSDGVMVVGDAAGLVINAGYTVRGMDLAIASGEAASKAIITAKEQDDYSAASLARYQDLLDRSFVMQDLKQYQKFPEFMENPRIFNEYPQLVVNIFKDMFIVDGSPGKPLRKKVLNHAKQVGLVNLLKDAWKGVKAL